eukprot:GHVQ01025224.1.p1 GENE.GHVQ01025224.1~~GHVQ01025224.1.p1  ORF type:complete len:271 (+),score=36.13 GHVQ01025224.1:102-914(+)
MSSTGSWCLIESDPGVFTELVEDVGVQGVEFEELYAIDSVDHLFTPPVQEPYKDCGVSGGKDGRDTESNGVEVGAGESGKCGEVYGLVFLFKWVANLTKGLEEEEGNSLGRIITYQEHPTLFFAKQVIPNACATQAILSILMNSLPPKSLGPLLSSLHSFTADFDPTMKGLAISNSDHLRKTHNSFKANTSFDVEEDDDENDQRKKEDAFHFVSYVCFAGHCYELDGLSTGPRWLGEVKTGERWTTVALPMIQSRIQRSCAFIFTEHNRI